MSETIRCPSCGRRVPLTPLCENCGKPLPIQQTGLSEPHTSVLPQVKVTGSQQPVSSAEPVVPVRPVVPLRPVAPVPLGSPIQAVVPPSLVSPVEPVAPQASSSPALFKQTSIPSPQTTTFQPSRESTSRDDVPLKDDKPTLEIDERCTLEECQGGTLSVRFVPGKRTSHNVAFKITESGLAREKCAWNLTKSISELKSSEDAYSFDVQLPAYERVGKIAFDIEFQYELDGVIEKWLGTCTVKVLAKEIQNNHIKIIAQQASEVKITGLAGNDLRCREDGIRFVKCRLVRDSMSSLPSPQPTGTKADRLVLDLGAQRLLLFSGRTVTFGRNRGLCDISWRHPDADRIGHDDPANIPYRKISGQQCSFEHRGDKVALIDGVRDARGVVKPSSYGTSFNAVRVEGVKLLASGGTGRGLITFSDSAATGTLSVCLPNDVCAKCMRAERTWCGGGKRPSLVFKRLDGVPESAVMVWSCFRLEEVDPSFEGVKIFRSDGGFAWRRGRRCGWLVPGESIETECGTVHVRHLPSPEEIAKEKDVRITSETCHS